MRRRVSLPEGYRLIETRSRVSLIDPKGRVLRQEPRGSEGAAILEECAWRDIFEHIDQELQEEIRAFREGNRTLHDLPWLRQYMRMLDAIAGTGPSVLTRPAWNPIVAGLAVAASVALIAGGLLMAPLRIARGPDGGETRPGQARPVSGLAKLSPARQASLNASNRDRRQGSVTHLRSAGTRLENRATGYAVSLGEFASNTAAEIRMHLVRGKGYIVYVRRIGDSFHVVTRPYPTKKQAEQLAQVFEEIGLPARAHLAIPELL